MIALKITDIKNFMGRLLIKEEFDSFLTERAEVLTSFEMSLSGRRNSDWYDTDTREEMLQEQPEDALWMRWGEMKPFIFDFIKGKQTPAYMKISFRLAKKQVNTFLEDSGVMHVYQEQQPELLFQVRFEHGELMIVTGIAFSQFTLDKTMERAWDEAMIRFFKNKKIACEE